MAQTIHLNGGPMHDQQVAIPDDRDHFHIIEPASDAIQRAIQEMKDEDTEQKFQRVPLREGMYSRVQGYPGEYEWDGWRSHD